MAIVARETVRFYNLATLMLQTADTLEGARLASSTLRAPKPITDLRWNPACWDEARGDQQHRWDTCLGICSPLWVRASQSLLESNRSKLLLLVAGSACYLSSLLAITEDADWATACHAVRINDVTSSMAASCEEEGCGECGGTQPLVSLPHQLDLVDSSLLDAPGK